MSSMPRHSVHSDSPTTTTSMSISNDIDGDPDNNIIVSSSSLPSASSAHRILLPSSSSSSSSSSSLFYQSSAQSHSLLLKKLNNRLLIFLCIIYFFSFVDRANVSNVHTAIEASLSFSPSQYSYSIIIFYVPYILFEVPENYLLSRYNIRIGLFLLILVWGILSTLIAFIQSYSMFLLFRFLLGIFEAGLFPGLVYYITLWYSSTERSAALFYLFLAQPLAGVGGGLFAFFVLQTLHNTFGLEGWRWLMLIEGLPSVILAFVTFFYLPTGPDDEKKSKWLTNEERTFLIERRKWIKDGKKQEEKEKQRIINSGENSINHNPDSALLPSSSIDDTSSFLHSDSSSTSIVSRISASLQLFSHRLGALYRSTFRNVAIYLFMLVNFVLQNTVQSIMFFLVSLVTDLDATDNDENENLFNDENDPQKGDSKKLLYGNLYSIIPFFFATISMYFVSQASDRYPHRRPFFVIIPACFSTIGFLLSFILLLWDPSWHPSYLLALHIFFLSIAASGLWASKPCFMAWVSSNLVGDIAVGVAAVIAVGNLSGVIAPLVMAKIKESTGSYGLAVAFLAANMLIVVGGCWIIYQFEKRNKKSSIQMVENSEISSNNNNNTEDEYEEINKSGSESNSAYRKVSLTEDRNDSRDGEKINEENVIRAGVYYTNTRSEDAHLNDV